MPRGRAIPYEPIGTTEGICENLFGAHFGGKGVEDIISWGFGRIGGGIGLCPAVRGLKGSRYTEFREAREKELTYFRLSLSGEPERATRTVGKIDGDGRPVKGSAVEEIWDHKAPGVKKLIQEELDFWITGGGRKSGLVSKENAAGGNSSSNPKESR